MNNLVKKTMIVIKIKSGIPCLLLSLTLLLVLPDKHNEDYAWK
jgi:hypothetical protein